MLDSRPFQQSIELGGKSFKSSQDGASNPSDSDDNLSLASSRRRGIRRRSISRRISEPRSEPSNSSTILEMLPWIIGLIWLFTVAFFGSK